MAKTKIIEIIIHEEKCTGCRICQLMCSSIYKQRYSPAEAFIQIDDAYETLTFIRESVHETLSLWSFRTKGG